MRKIILSLAATATLAVPVTPALAGGDREGRYYRDDDRHGRYYRDDDRRGRHYRDYDRRGRYDRAYDERGRYYEPRRIHRGDRVWRGNDGRYYCQRDNGTTGLIIGAAGGALLGREVDGGRERTLGTILGAAAGALIGREVDRGEARCR